MISGLIKNLQVRLGESLPGEHAQKLMAPSVRTSPGWKPGKGPSKPSGVLLLLYPDDHEMSTVLMLRASGGPHSGQVSLPGGRKESGDKNLQDTALRETYEEIGVEAQYVNILGTLTDLYVPNSHFSITPFVGWCEKKPIFTADDHEVKKVLPVSLKDLFAPENRKEKILHYPEYDIRAPYYLVSGEMVWGATAMIISEFEVVFTSCTP